MGPSITIITPVLNRVAVIQEALDSVHNQHYPALDHIVVDGGSTDGTLDIVRTYPRVRLIVGRDNGMYDAINKALRLATGDFIALLNSDDKYEPGIFAEVAQAAETHPEAQVIYGDTVLFELDANGQRRVLHKKASPSRSRVDFSAMLEGLPINACFIRRSLYERLGGFSDQYRIAGDRDFMIRLAEASPEAHYLRLPVYAYRVHQGSLTFRAGVATRARMEEEQYRVGMDWLARQKISLEARRHCRYMVAKSSFVLMTISFREHDMIGAFRWLTRGLLRTPGPFLDRLGVWVTQKARFVASGRPGVRS